VSCTSTTMCVAVGSANDRPLVWRWNGITWAAEATPAVYGDLGGVSCSSAHACMAVGQQTSSTGFHLSTLAEEWDGTTWSIQPTPSPTPVSRNPSPGGSSLWKVSCARADACMAIGYATGDSGNSAFTESWNGTSWALQTPPNPGYELENISCTAPNGCTAVGYHRTRRFFFFHGPDVASAEMWNGRSWSSQPLPSLHSSVGSSLAGVSCTTTDTCTAVGTIRSKGKILSAGVIAREPPVASRATK
jgi:hypothetical protein